MSSNAPVKKVQYTGRARADLMLGSTDSSEATSSNATRATDNYEVDTPMTGSLTSGARPPAGSNTMVSSLDTMDPLTAVQMESLEHQSTSEQDSHDYEVQEPDSDTEKLELDSRVPRAKERTIMFDSTDTLCAVSGDRSVRDRSVRDRSVRDRSVRGRSVRDAAVQVEAPGAVFYIGDTPYPLGERFEDHYGLPIESGSCPEYLLTNTEPPPSNIPRSRSRDTFDRYVPC